MWKVMKNLVTKSIYAGLGLLGSGKESVEQLGRKLAKQADISEKEGEKIARQLQERSHRAAKIIQDTLEKEVNLVISAFNAVGHQAAPHKKPKSKPRQHKTKHTPSA
jgi:hypothetical protein